MTQLAAFDTLSSAGGARVALRQRLLRRLDDGPVSFAGLLAAKTGGNAISLSLELEALQREGEIIGSRCEGCDGPVYRRLRRGSVLSPSHDVDSTDPK